MTTATGLEQITSRAEMTRMFDGHAFERRNEIDQQRMKRPLVKSHLLEVFGGCGDHPENEVVNLFARCGVQLINVEPRLYRVRAADVDQGFLEMLSPRLTALYSILHSKDIDRFVKQLVQSTPEIDHVWLSGRTFNVLWEVVTRKCTPNRYVRMVFKHDSVFDIDAPTTSSDDDGQDEAHNEGDSDEAADEYTPINERRAARFQLDDKICVVQDKLKRLQDTYAPLHAISALRFPSSVGRGGHDFYDNGKVTNRSDSFRDHRSHVLYVRRVYEQMLGRTEHQLWYGVRDATPSTADHRIEGAPLVVTFAEALSSEVFDQWLNSTFRRRNNRFRLWGNPIRLGPTKAHVYGLDKHLWQPLFLELTERGCVAIIPQGTCGNTVHRLVTNIQRYLDPAAQAYIGDMPYDELVKASSSEVVYDDGS